MKSGIYDNIFDFPQLPFKLERYDDIVPNTDDSALIEGAFDLAGLSVIYGASNSGKTFWAMDAALHIAAGLPWRGLKVQTVPVLYLALEGGRGAVNRIVAWRKRFGLEGVPFWLVRSSVNLLDPAAGTEEIKRASNTIKGLCGARPGLTIVDTLARAIAGGNENSGEDMGAVVRNADAIRDHTQGAFWFIHHSGKDEAWGARGHSALRAATDTEIEISEGEGGFRTARATKQRDMEMAGEWGFRLQVETLATFPDRKAVTSCTVEHLTGEPGEPVRRRPRPPGQAGMALDVLKDVLAVCGQPPMDSENIPFGVLVVPVAAWREAFNLRAMPDDMPGTRSTAFRRASDKLINDKYIAKYGDVVWLV